MSFLEMVNNCLAMLNPEFCWFVALSLLHTIWQAGLLALLVAALVRCKLPHSPHQRFVLQFVVLLLIGSLPVINYLWMANANRVPEQIQLAHQQFLDGQLKLFPVDDLAVESSKSDGSKLDRLSLVPETAVQLGTISKEYVVSPPSPPAWRWPIVFTVVGTLLYLLGAFAMLFKLGWSLFVHRGLRQFKRQMLTGDTIPGPLRDAFERAAESLARNLKTPMWLFSGVGSAMVVGVFKPVILVNVALLSGLTPRQLEQILAHEMAHVIRWDPITLLIQRIVESLLFFHPAVWYVSRQISMSREICCDDLVARSYQSVDYAQTLMACLSFSKAGAVGADDQTSSFSLAAIGTSQSQFVTRIQTLLEIDSRHITRGERMLSGKVVAVTMSICIAFVALWNWNSQSAVPIASFVPAQILHVADNEWTWQTVEPGAVHRTEVMFNGHDLELQSEIPADIQMQAMVSREDCQFGQWQFGDLSSTRVAIVAEYEGTVIVRVYVDANRNRVIEESEEVRTKLDWGKSWIVDLDAEVNEDDQVVHVQRQVAITQKRKRGMIKISTLGFAAGTLEIDGQQFEARRLDVNGNGLPTDRVDKLWIDFDQDGKFEPITERLNLSATLDHAGHRYAIHSDRIGHQLKLASADDQGQVKFIFELEDAAATIDSLEGSLRDEFGMVIAIRLSDEPIEIPVGKYCISNLVVKVRDTDDMVWRMSLTRGFEQGWFEISKDAVHKVQLLEKLELYASAIRERNLRTGTDASFLPQYYTSNGLVITDFKKHQRGERQSLFGNIDALFTLDNQRLPNAEPQSCSSGFA